MKNILITLLFIPLLIFSQNNLFKVTFFTGKSYIKTEKSKKWIILKGGMYLEKDAIIKTGNKSIVILSSGSKKLTLKSNSLVSMKSIYNNKSSETTTKLSFQRRLYSLIVGKSRTSKRTMVGGVRGSETDSNQAIKWSDDLEDDDSFIKQAEESYKKGKIKNAIIILVKNSHNVSSDQKNYYNYLLAISYFQNGDFKKSIKFFKVIENNWNDRDKNELRLIFHAMALHYTNQNKEGFAVINRFLSMYPKGNLTADAYYFKALMHLSLNQKKDAKKSLKKIIKRFPNTKSARDAEKKLESL